MSERPKLNLSDARKVAPEKWKTVIRHPIKRRVLIQSDDAVDFDY